MRNRRTSPATYGLARALRKTPTASEARLWAYLRGRKVRGVSFRRQHAIGTYVVDFCAPRHRLVVEVDGGAHAQARERDALRTAALQARGFRVLRFWNNDVMSNIQGVIQAIEDALNLAA